jgi:hypothetical protein
MYDWDFNLVWEYYVAKDTVELAHHEFRPLPNGNLLILAWEWKSLDEAIASGRNPALLTGTSLWPEKIVEVRPILPDSGEIVWQWNQWDHIIQDFDSTKANYGVVTDHPELWDMNYAPITSGDWVHANALDYDPVTDQILLSSRDLGEIYVIDHSTTTEEAAGHTGGRWGKGGDILFRFGNPQAYSRGDASDQVFYDAHGASWVDWGIEDEWEIVVFNDGLNRPGGNYSDVLQIAPMRDADSNYVLEDGEFVASTTIIYEADPPQSFYARFLSGAAKIEDDKYLVSDGPGGTFFEVDNNQNITWRYIVPVDQMGPLTQGHQFAPVEPGNPKPNFIFRATKYSLDDPVFDNQDVSSDGFIELQALESLCTVDTTSDTTTGIDLDLFVSSISVFPNPVHAGSDLIIRNASAYNLQSISLVNTASQEVCAEFRASRSSYLNTFKLPAELPAGVYLLRFEFEQKLGFEAVYRKLVVY